MQESEVNLSVFDYINSRGLDNAVIKSAQTAAFISYVVACGSLAWSYIKGSRFFDFRIFKNKVYIFAFIINLLGVSCAVFIPSVRDFLEFGELGWVNLGIAVLIGFCPAIFAVFFRKKVFFGRG